MNLLTTSTFYEFGLFPLKEQEIIYTSIPERNYTLFQLKGIQVFIY